MGALLERLRDRQHLLVALLSAWLIFTSPWISMLRRIPDGAGFLDYSHVVLGFVALLLAFSYAVTCSLGGRWRLYFPFIAGGLGAVGRDLAGLLRGRIPAAEGGGLFALIEGLLLLALLAAAVTGAAWFWAQGTTEALAWRQWHLYAARGLAGLILLHVVTVSLHLLDFVRD
jgi:cytochrome b561